MNSIFCQKCGMLKNKCVCSDKEEEGQQHSLIDRPTKEEKEALQAKLL